MSAPRPCAAMNALDFRVEGRKEAIVGGTEPAANSPHLEEALLPAAADALIGERVQEVREG